MTRGAVLSLELVRLTLRTRRLATFWFSIGVALYALLIMGLWPLFKDIDWQAMAEAFGGTQTFGGVTSSAATAQENAFYQYWSSQYTTWVTLVMTYVGVWFGAGVIVRDFGAGTLDVLLAAPISRTRFLAARGAAVAAAALLVAAASLLGVLVGAAVWITDVALSPRDLALIHVQLLLFTLAFAGVGALLGALILQPGRTYGIAAALVVLMFVLTIVADVASAAEWLGRLSLFGYWNPIDQAATGAFAWRDALVLGGSAVVTFGAALAVFRRRDLAA